MGAIGCGEAPAAIRTDRRGICEEAGQTPFATEGERADGSQAAASTNVHIVMIPPNGNSSVLPTCRRRQAQAGAGVNAFSNAFHDNYPKTDCYRNALRDNYLNNNCYSEHQNSGNNGGRQQEREANYALIGRQWGIAATITGGWPQKFVAHCCHPSL